MPCSDLTGKVLSFSSLSMMLAVGFMVGVLDQVDEVSSVFSIFILNEYWVLSDAFTAIDMIM